MRDSRQFGLVQFTQFGADVVFVICPMTVRFEKFKSMLTSIDKKSISNQFVRVVILIMILL